MANQVPIRERVADEDSTGDSDISVAIYARTSSQSQTYGYSLEQQVRQSIQRCRQRGWEVTFVYRDEAESGGDTDRPMFQTMLQAAKQQAFDVIVFWRLDRFSRSLIHAVKLEEELREYGVELYSVTEQIDTTTPTGRFNFRNIANAAEFERELIKQRTQAGLEGMAAEHKWPNDTPPLGYDLDEEQRLVINPDESELIKEIFSLFIELRSMPEVAAEFNKRGIRTSDGGEWTPRAVGDILRNEIYTGQYELANVSEHVPEYQIIETQIFDRVTEIRHRFQNDDASQKSMPDSQKAEDVRTIKGMYESFLDAQKNSH